MRGRSSGVRAAAARARAIVSPGSRGAARRHLDCGQAAGRMLMPRVWAKGRGDSGVGTSGCAEWGHGCEDDDVMPLLYASVELREVSRPALWGSPMAWGLCPQALGEPASAVKNCLCLVRVASRTGYSRHHSHLNNLNHLRTCVKPANSNPGIVMQLTGFRSPVQYFFGTSNYDSVKNNISEYVQAQCSSPFPLASIICRNCPQNRRIWAQIPRLLH